VSDLFRAGHVALLREARRHGDRLLVGVRSDAAAAPTLGMGIASSCMTAPPRLKIAYDKDTKGAEGRSQPRFSFPASTGYGTGADFGELSLHTVS
jgi:cytidyltransferase-like protein